MAGMEPLISPIRFSDIATITRMAHDNMNGNDRQFTKLMANPLSRWTSYLALPLYFLWAGKGFKFVQDGRIAGCAYLHLQPNSGYVFNVNVNGPYRRRGIAQQLMAKLEELTWGYDRRWIALQVDTDNLAARNLYKKIGFRPYNSSYLRFEGSFLTEDIEQGVIHLERLSAYNGRHLFNRYLAHEKENGESVEAAVIDDYESRNFGAGPYWRCIFNGHEIGSIRRKGAESRPIFYLAFYKSNWGQPSLPGIIEALISQLEVQLQRVDLVFGSSHHYLRAKETLADYGFEERNHPRMLMFKSLSEEEVGPNKNLARL
jgi:GNAT superfamily N-acetyltransferase